MAACSKINTRVVTFTTFYQFNQRTVFTQKTNKQKYSKGWKHHIANSSEQFFFYLLHLLKRNEFVKVRVLSPEF